MSLVSGVCFEVEVSASGCTRPDGFYRQWCVVVCDREVLSGETVDRIRPKVLRRKVYTAFCVT